MYKKKIGQPPKSDGPIHRRRRWRRRRQGRFFFLAFSRRRLLQRWRRLRRDEVGSGGGGTNDERLERGLIFSEKNLCGMVKVMLNDSVRRFLIRN